MVNNAEISVIMGTHNDFETIHDCIYSVINQSFKDWEFIICDDFSDKEYFLKLKQYEKLDNRIKILRNKENRGLAFCLNRCLKTAQGKYIARMDADDISYKNRFDRQFMYLESHPKICMVGSGMAIFDGEKTVRDRISPQDVTKNDFLKGNPFFHPTMMIRKDIFEKIGLYNTTVKRVEDLELWFRIYANGYQGANIPDILYQYHESIKDYKKRTFLAAIDISRVFINGYQALNISRLQYWRALRPLVSAILPNYFVCWYHQRKLFPEKK